MEATIFDVAMRAGVSKSTVSLVLNGRPGVSEATREAVLRVAAELGYSVRRQPVDPPPATRTLLLICQRYPGRRVDDLGFVYSAYITGVRQATNAQGCDLVVWPLTTEEVDASQSPTDLMLDTVQADGALVVGLRSPDDPLLSRLQELDLPFLALGRHCPTADISCIGIDDRQAWLAATEHLINLGHREIALLAEDPTHTFMWHRPRVEGFAEALRRHALTHLAERVLITPTAEEGVRQALARWPATTALLAIHDHWGQDAVRALRAQGIDVPRHVSVLSHDNVNGLELLPGRESPPVQLTSVDPQQLEAGRLGAQALLRCIEEKQVGHVQITLQWRLVKRASTGPPAL